MREAGRDVVTETASGAAYEIARVVQPPPRRGDRSDTCSRKCRGYRAGLLLERPGETRAVHLSGCCGSADPRQSSGTESRKRIRTLGADRAHQLFRAAGANQIDGTAIAEKRVHSEQPGERSRPLVET